jgi:hypothetical protein
VWREQASFRSLGEHEPASRRPAAGGWQAISEATDDERAVAAATDGASERRSVSPTLGRVLFLSAADCQRRRAAADECEAEVAAAGPGGLRKAAQSGEPVGPFGLTFV